MDNFSYIRAGVEMNSTMTSMAQSRLSAVWDPLVRITHWLLVGAFTAAYISAEEDVGTADNWHVWAVI